jgi:hypothetical protein
MKYLLLMKVLIETFLHCSVFYYWLIFFNVLYTSHRILENPRKGTFRIGRLYEDFYRRHWLVKKMLEPKLNIQTF